MGRTVEPFNFNQMTRRELSDPTGRPSPELLARPVGGSAGFAEWFDSLPRVLAGGELHDLVEAIVAARTALRPVHLAMGMEIVRTGLGPVFADLVERGIVTAVSVTGAFVASEFELAATGCACHDAGENSRGARRQTGEALAAMVEAAHRTDGGLGAVAAAYLATQSLCCARHSVLASCHRYGVPVTVHAAIGGDDSHLEPTLDAAHLGAALMIDFRVYTTLIGELTDGVYWRVGGADRLPDVLASAQTALHATGRETPRLIAASLDAQAPDRPSFSAPAAGGRNLQLIGPIEILAPLLAAALVHRLWDPAEDE